MARRKVGTHGSANRLGVLLGVLRVPKLYRAVIKMRKETEAEDEREQRDAVTARRSRESQVRVRWEWHHGAAFATDVFASPRTPLPPPRSSVLACRTLRRLRKLPPMPFSSPFSGGLFELVSSVLSATFVLTASARRSFRTTSPRMLGRPPRLPALGAVPLLGPS